MKNYPRIALLAFLMGLVQIVMAQSNDLVPSLQVQTTNGALEGTYESGIRVFRGIPFAQPPVGELRWREPQPVKNWTGVRKADQFGPRAMQRPLFGDMNFRSNGMSEDCLYLNVWTPATSADDKLPVLVYFYGGGLMAGDGSEPRYAGESMARRGIVALTVNYRLGIFGFFAHPELTKESPHRSSGNYGLLDQTAALQWIKANIAAFGGDPERVTIAGESAGSASVCAQMASPLAKDLIAGAIGSSGAMLGARRPPPLSEGEQMGVAFAKAIGAQSLAELRAMSAEKLLNFDMDGAMPRFPVVIDGWLLPKSPQDIFLAGEQAQVPLLVGWNSEESSYRAILGQEAPTVANYEQALRKLYGERADAVLKAYAAASDDEVMDVATQLAGDRFTGFSTWKWAELHSQTSERAVYRYLYARPRPAMRPEMGNAEAGLAGGVIRSDDAGKPKAPLPRGAVHSAEIEYAMGNLPTNRVYDWQPEDFQVSEIFKIYYENFVKTGDPNGLGVPAWPTYEAGEKGRFLYIDVDTKVKPDKQRARYLLWEGM